jgi:hypothetical protein
LKFAYVDLPGHPFYGQKVRIIQEGRTGKVYWCLIAHPNKEGLHYQISKRWLCENFPDQSSASTKDFCQRPIPIEALEKAALFLKILSCRDDNIIKAEGEKSKDKRSKEDLGKFTNREKTRSRNQIVLHNPDQGREGK